MNRRRLIGGAYASGGNLNRCGAQRGIKRGGLGNGGNFRLGNKRRKDPASFAGLLLNVNDTASRAIGNTALGYRRAEIGGTLFRKLAVLYQRNELFARQRPFHRSAADDYTVAGNQLTADGIGGKKGRAEVELS